VITKLLSYTKLAQISLVLIVGNNTTVYFVNKGCLRGNNMVLYVCMDKHTEVVNGNGESSEKI
jgi:hypothetical protein